MTTDKGLQQAVIDELGWDPSIDSAQIGVTASGGIITLSGHVPTFAEKYAAERAAARVAGVKSVAEEIEVRPRSEHQTADDEIARRAVQSLDWDVNVPAGKVKVKVEKGWVTLSGEVDWYFQRVAAAADVGKLHGVTGVSNNIRIEPRVSPSAVREKIRAALDRNARLEDSNIGIETEGGTVTLIGTVHSWHDRDLAERTAWSAPGVTMVQDELAVD